MKIIIGGDIRPIDSESSIQLGVLLKERISKCNHFILNLECAGTGGKQIKKVGTHISCNSCFITNLQELGIKILTCANNHFGDYGEIGIIRNIELCRHSGIQTIGAYCPSINSESTHLGILEFDKFNLFNLAGKEFGTTFNNDKSGVTVFDPFQTYKTIQKYSGSEKPLIMIYHGGVEYCYAPLPYYKKLFRSFIDAGASAIVCHHSHFYSGYEYYSNGFIAYGLGNFISKTRNYKHMDAFKIGLLLEICINEKIDYNLIPIYSEYSPSIVEIIEGKKRLKINNHIKELNKIILEDRLLIDYWLEHIYANNVLGNYKFLFDQRNELLKKILRRFGLYKYKMSADQKIKYLNLIRNEAHRNLIILALEHVESEVS